MNLNRTRPAPDAPTTADLAEYGAAECLAALRIEFTEAMKRYDQYRGWTDDTVLGVVNHTIGGHGTFVRALPGDLVLVKRDRYRGSVFAGIDPNDMAYIPRMGDGWVSTITLGMVTDVAAAGA